MAGLKLNQTNTCSGPDYPEVNVDKQYYFCELGKVISTLSSNYGIKTFRGHQITVTKLLSLWKKVVIIK